MDGWILVLLGVIAAATTIMAVLQVGAALQVRRLSRRVAELNEEVRPLVARVNDISSDAARATSLVVTQVERADRVFRECAQRFDQTMGLVQDAVATPAQEGMALMDGLRAGLAAIRPRQTESVEEANQVNPPPSESRSSEDEDPLFIG